MQRSIQQQVAAYETPLTPTMTVRRVFPGKMLKNVDPFVFFDHFGPADQEPRASDFSDGTGAHPHRGFSTFTYLFEGEMEHFDSRGHHGAVSAGGAQWMKAGSGIIHDERPPQAFQQCGGVLHGLQLWINLPKSHKEDTPAYFNLPSTTVPERPLAGGSVLRVLIGEWDGAQSPVPTYSPMAVWHVRTAPGAEVNLPVPADWNAVIYTPTQALSLNGATLPATQLALFKKDGDSIGWSNPGTAPADVLVLAGAPIGEPIYASGPFVMADIPGIQKAYDDFYAGKYGEIEYLKG